MNFEKIFFFKKSLYLFIKPDSFGFYNWFHNKTSSRFLSKNTEWINEIA